MNVNEVEMAEGGSHCVGGGGTLFVAERAQRSEAMRGERRRLNAGAFSYEGATGGSMLVAGKE